MIRETAVCTVSLQHSRDSVTSFSACIIIIIIVIKIITLTLSEKLNLIKLKPGLAALYTSSQEMDWAIL